MLLNDLSDDEDENQIFFQDDFIYLFESHRQLFLDNNWYSTLYVTTTEAARYAGDLEGLLNFKQYPNYLIHTVIILNGISNAMDIDQNLEMLLLPTIEEVQQLASVSLSSATAL